MIIQHRRLARRTGAALVETAAVVAVFCMILFGVVEFCRFFFMRQLIDNAAREGARYAVVHTADASVDPVGNAAFGQYIGVELTCDYDPITPTLLRLNQTVQIHVKSLMYSEAN